MQNNFNCQKSPYILYTRTFWTEGFLFLGRWKKKENPGGRVIKGGGNWGGIWGIWIFFLEIILNRAIHKRNFLSSIIIHLNNIFEIVLCRIKYSSEMNNICSEVSYQQLLFSTYTACSISCLTYCVMTFNETLCSVQWMSSTRVIL